MYESVIKLNLLITCTAFTCVHNYVELTDVYFFAVYAIVVNNKPTH